MLKFNSVAEVRDYLSKLTSLKDIEQDITYVNAANNRVTAKWLGLGSFQNTRNAVWMAEEDVDTLQIDFTGSDNNITVSNVKVTR